MYRLYVKNMNMMGEGGRIYRGFFFLFFSYSSYSPKSEGVLYTNTFSNQNLKPPKQKQKMIKISCLHAVPNKTFPPSSFLQKLNKKGI